MSVSKLTPIAQNHPAFGVFCIVIQQRARHCSLSAGVEPIEGCLLLDFVCAKLYRLYGIAVRISSLSARPQCRTDDLGHPFCFFCAYMSVSKLTPIAQKTIPIVQRVCHRNISTQSSSNYLFTYIFMLCRFCYLLFYC